MRAKRKQICHYDLTWIVYSPEFTPGGTLGMFEWGQAAGIPDHYLIPNLVQLNFATLYWIKFPKSLLILESIFSTKEITEVDAVFAIKLSCG